MGTGMANIEREIAAGAQAIRGTMSLTDADYVARKVLEAAGVPALIDQHRGAVDVDLIEGRIRWEACSAGVRLHDSFIERLAKAVVDTITYGGQSDA